MNRRKIRPTNGNGLKGDRMELPYWVEEDIRKLPADFTGQIVIECWHGGVTRVDTKTSRQAPKVGEMKKDDRK